MGFFNKILGSDAPTSLTKEEALTGILLAAVAADGHISNEEIDDFNSFANKSKTLRNMGAGAFNRMIDKLLRILKRDGVNQLIQLSTENLPPELAQSSFAMACDLLFSDGVVDREEEKVLELLKDNLSIDDAVAQKIAEVLVIKNKA